MILFKSERLEKEFYEELNVLVRALYLELNDWMERKYGISLVITCVVRTEEENVAVGGTSKSAHITKRAGDARSRDLTEEQKEAVIARIKKNWPIPMIHALIHKGGTGEHIHVNVNRAYA